MGPDARDYVRMTELEISSARFDQPRVDPALPRRKLVICATQRSGSFLLCRQLINAGIGVPQEYLHHMHIGLLCRRWNVNDAQAYLRELHALRTTANGIWATKAQWPQYLRDQHLAEAALADARGWILLHRRDVYAQAVSLHISVATGIWGFDTARTTPLRDDIRLGDPEHVARCVRRIESENMAWRQFLGSRGIQPLVIGYEDFAANQPNFVGRIAGLLGLDDSEYRLPPPEAQDNRLPPDIESVKRQLLSRRDSPSC